MTLDLLEPRKPLSRTEFRITKGDVLRAHRKECEHPAITMLKQVNQLGIEGQRVTDIVVTEHAGFQMVEVFTFRG